MRRQRGVLAPLRLRARPRRKAVLAVCAMAGETAWLDGHPRWADGAVVWEVDGRSFRPSIADLATAERRLRQIARYTFAGRRVLGDPEAWRAKRRGRLELAKRLCRLGPIDAETTALAARRGEASAIGTLVELLVAEAACVGGLPLSPAAALAAAGPAAGPALVAAVEEQALPEGARALAALALGALGRRGAAWRELPDGATAWCRRSYQLGQRLGLPIVPTLVVHGLAEAEETGARMAGALSRPGPFALPVGFLLELLDGGAAPRRVAALMEAALDGEGLVDRLRPRGEAADTPARSTGRRRRPPTWVERRDEAARRADEAGQAVGRLAGAFHAWARATAEPADLALVRRCAEGLLALGPPSLELAVAVAGVVERALELPPPLARAYLALVVEQRDRIWRRPMEADPPDPPPSPEWVGGRETAVLRPMRKLLRLTADPTLVRRAVELGACAHLAWYRWRDPATCRWVLATLARFEGSEPWRARRLVRAVLACGERDARRVLQPLVDAALTAPPQHRWALLKALLDAVVDRERPPEELLPLALRHVPALAAAMAGADHPACSALLPAAIEAERSCPRTAADVVAALLDGLRALRPPGKEEPDDWAIEVAGEVAVALAADRPGQTGGLVAALAPHLSDEGTSWLREGARLSRRFPRVRAALADLLAEHPRRGTRLLVRLGLTTRMRDDPLAPIAALEGTLATPTAEEPGDWSAVVSAWPDLAEDVGTCLVLARAGGLEASPPPGIRELVEQPARLASELAHIEDLLAADPARADLRRRATNLRGRLADRARLMAVGHDEVRARLARLIGAARLTLVERAVAECYRARLEALVGPRAHGILLNEDLLNAGLLSVGLASNRRLLRRLLDAHLAGDRGWRERHPANAAFLARLAAGGVDVEAWLSRSPCTYPFAPAKGGRVRMWLETEPLRVLQMGNHFDTCLSWGGVNAFATVANAAELNKRVVYAADAAGRVVGRKLVGLTAEGKLVGFRTYTRQGRGDGRALRALFERYLADFADRCRLELADAGAVPRLFAEAWYDDGVVPWRGEDGGERPRHASVRPVGAPS